MDERLSQESVHRRRIRRSAGEQRTNYGRPPQRRSVAGHKRHRPEVSRFSARQVRPSMLQARQTLGRRRTGFSVFSPLKDAAIEYNNYLQLNVPAGASWRDISWLASMTTITVN